MNSKRKILILLFLVFVLAVSASIVSASEATDDQIDASNIDDDSLSNDLEIDDASLNSVDSISTDVSSSDIKLESSADESIQSTIENNEVLSEDSKKNIYARVYGGQYKEGSNATIEICLLDKANYYTEESVLYIQDKHSSWSI